MRYHCVMKIIPLKSKMPGENPETDHTPSPARRKRVRRLAGLGVPPLQIAASLGCTLSQLNELYSAEQLAGAAETSEIAGSALLSAVQEGNVQAAIWWSKARMGWTEKAELELNGGESPIRTEVVRRIIDPAQD